MPRLIRFDISSDKVMPEVTGSSVQMRKGIWLSINFFIGTSSYDWYRPVSILLVGQTSRRMFLSRIKAITDSSSTALTP